jgi:hypothetical protein
LQFFFGIEVDGVAGRFGGGGFFPAFHGPQIKSIAPLSVTTHPTHLISGFFSLALYSGAFVAQRTGSTGGQWVVPNFVFTFSTFIFLLYDNRRTLSRTNQ